MKPDLELVQIGRVESFKAWAFVAAAPRMSQTFDQYRTKQQPIAAHVITLAIAAALTADALFHGIAERLGGRAQQFGKSPELADDLLGVTGHAQGQHNYAYMLENGLETAKLIRREENVRANKL